MNFKQMFYDNLDNLVKQGQQKVLPSGKVEYVVYLRINDLTEFEESVLSEYGLVNGVYTYVGMTTKNYYKKQIRSRNFKRRIKDKLENPTKHTTIDIKVAEVLSRIVQLYMGELNLTEDQAYNKAIEGQVYLVENLTRGEAKLNEKMIQDKLQRYMLNIFSFNKCRIILMNSRGARFEIYMDGTTVKLRPKQKSRKYLNEQIHKELQQGNDDGTIIVVDMEILEIKKHS